MTYRSIFVHVDDSSRSDLRLDAAMRLARRYPADVLGTYLVSRHELSASEIALLPPDFVRARDASVMQAVRDAEARFRSAMKTGGIGTSHWLVPAGDPAEAAVTRARYSDLAIVGQPEPGAPEAALAAAIAHAVVNESGRPVIFVPHIGLARTLGERVMIAWKDSRESARAVADALPILKDAKEVLAVAVAPGPEETVQEYVSDKAVMDFLRRHGVAAAVKRMNVDDVGAGEFLLSRAADFGADLIVMGGYSRPRLSRFVWGGVSNLMLESMTVPVLMSH